MFLQFLRAIMIPLSIDKKCDNLSNYICTYEDRQLSSPSQKYVVENIAYSSLTNRSNFQEKQTAPLCYTPFSFYTLSVIYCDENMHVIALATI